MPIPTAASCRRWVERRLTERMANVIDLRIDRISLELHAAAGHEHRVQPIVAPAAVEALSAAPLRLDLAGMGDEEATNRIADGMLEAIAPYLGGSSWPR